MSSAKSVQRNDMIKQIYHQFNKSAFICVYLRFVLASILPPYFSMKHAPASDSAGFLTELNDEFIEINISRRCEN
jgi:hypothetical protein